MSEDSDEEETSIDDERIVGNQKGSAPTVASENGTDTPDAVLSNILISFFYSTILTLLKLLK